LRDKAIEIERASVSYRKEVVLTEISLEIEEGTFLLILGPNGAGKTTLLTLINGMGRLISGSVRVFGKRPDYRIRREIGYVPQSLSIDPRSPILVEDVVLMGRAGRRGLLRQYSPEDKRIAWEAMELMGIQGFAKRPIGHLSSGEHQKVEIARALAQQPRILLLDEPTTNLDPKAQEELIELIDRIYREKSLTTLLVLHILSHIPKGCREVVMLKKGRLFWKGRRDSLKEELLSRLYNA